MKEYGAKLLEKVDELIVDSKCENIFSTAGHPTWTFLQIKDVGSYNSYELKTYFLQEVFKRGLVTIGSHNISFSHDDEALKKLLIVYEEVFNLMKSVVENENLFEKLEVSPLKPLFKVR